ncbi:MAG TPA: ABC transporter permease [Rudaea sp.]|jgi:ABC-2 type transport system permease protein|uniref:ABC transporter permease n=1 Tax=Rudaea sp. TaxID=2136325 RepID=UPI002F93A1B7
MNTITAATLNPIATTYPVSRSLPAYAFEAKYEFLRVLRTPAFAIPSLMFPPLFYLLFGVLLNRNSAAAAHYLFATYSVFGVMAPGLFGFGVGVAIERERGWLALKRVAPMPPGAYLLAKMIMAMLFALIIYVILAAMAYTLGGVRLQLAQWLLLGLITTFGVLPFCALGLLIGSRVNAAAAPAIVNFIYLPMAFLSGLWMPLSMLPEFIRNIAVLWPPHHLAQLALAASGREYMGGAFGHLVFLAAFTAICFAIARRWLARAA